VLYTACPLCVQLPAIVAHLLAALRLPIETRQAVLAWARYATFPILAASQSDSSPVGDFAFLLKYALRTMMELCRADGKNGRARC